MLRNLIIILMGLLSSTVMALDLELTQGINAALPVGIASFGDQGPAQEITNLIENDLRFSGQFRIISAPNNNSILQWQQAGADSVLTGTVQATGYDQYSVHYKLSDSQAQGRVLLEKTYTIHTPQARAIAHHISDEVYQKLTGERGVFSTRLAYILVNRTPDKTTYSLEISNIDSSFPRRLLTSSEPIMSPTWSPDGRNIAYVSFEKKRAQIYTVSVETGQRRLLTNFPGINGAPAWSPDARQLAVVLSKGGVPKIYSVDLSSGLMKQLTFGESIDTEPRYSADGSSLLFTSGRGGNPQIYRLILATGQITRLTYEGNYNARASYVPNKNAIIMLHREDRSFNIAMQPLNGGSLLQLTHSPMDESPSIAPNGRFVVYATHEQGRGILAMVSIDGRIKMHLPAQNGDIQEPAWSPFLN